MKVAFDSNTNLVNREINNYQKINYLLIPKYYVTIKDKNCLIIDYIECKHLKWKIKNCVYRDLKPNNIIIDENKRVYLIDFDRKITHSQETNATDFASEFVSPNANDIYSL